MAPSGGAFALSVHRNETSIEVFHRFQISQNTSPVGLQLIAEPRQRTSF